MQKVKSFIERYRMVQHNKPDEALGKIILERQGAQGLKFTNAMIDSSIDMSRKYRLTKSAVSMINFLCSPQIPGRAIDMRLPEINTWVEIEEPIDTPYETKLQAISLSRFRDRRVFEHALTQISLSSAQRKILEYSLFEDDSSPYNKDYTWSCDFIGIDACVFWKIGFHFIEGNKAELLQPPDYRCPWQACITEKDGIYPCEKCQDSLAFFTSWMATMLLMIAGAFSEESELDHFQIKQEYVTRQTQDIKKTWIKKDIQVRHQYHIVAFDACLRKEPAETLRRTIRGSWLESARLINPNMILYVEKHVMQTERTLRHERYVNKRGQTITVKAHEKRVPIKVSELKRKVTRVVASKYT